MGSCTAAARPHSAPRRHPTHRTPHGTRTARHGTAPHRPTSRPVLHFFTAKRPGVTPLPPPGPPPPSTKVTIAGNNKLYHRENLIGPFLVHRCLGPRPPSAPPNISRAQRPPLPLLALHKSALVPYFAGRDSGPPSDLRFIGGSEAPSVSPPPHQSDHRGRIQTSPSGKSDRAISSLQRCLGPRPPPPPPPLSTALPTRGGTEMTHPPLATSSSGPMAKGERRSTQGGTIARAQAPAPPPPVACACAPSLAPAQALALTRTHMGSCTWAGRCTRSGPGACTHLGTRT